MTSSGYGKRRCYVFCGNVSIEGYNSIALSYEVSSPNVLVEFYVNAKSITFEFCGNVKFLNLSEEENAADPKTIISREYSAEWKQGDEPYYPVNDDVNNALFAKYKALADAQKNVIFGGRLGEYKYYDMDVVIKEALEKAQEVISAD